MISTRVRLLVSYDGSCFSGFARNDGVETVAGSLEEHLARIFGSPVVVTGAGRTDKGVHAWGQVVTFDAPADAGVDLVRLRRSLNSMGRGAIVVREAAVVEPEFDARFSATWRRYRYSIVNRDVADPFSRHIAWHVSEPLDLDAMRQGAVPLIGQHDFSSFCRLPKSPRRRRDGGVGSASEQPSPVRVAEGGPERIETATVPSLVRRVLEASWIDEGEGRLRFEIRATAFCHQMVRSIVGCLVDVGRGRLRASDVRALLDARDRDGAPNLAPPQGLCLWEVGYDGEPRPGPHLLAISPRR